MTKSLFILLMLWLSSCAPSGSDPGYATIPPPAAPLATEAEPAPAQSARGLPCLRAQKGTPCSSATGLGTPASPVPGAAPPQSPALVPVGAPAAPAQPSLPALGSSVFGPAGMVGTVVNQTGNTAIVAPAGGGAPGIYVPNGNGTATIFQPGGVPVVVPMR